MLQVAGWEEPWPTWLNLALPDECAAPGAAAAWRGQSVISDAAQAAAACA